MEQAPKGGWKEIQAPSIDRDIRVSKEYASHVFDAARRHKWFNQPCESHLKVAFQGWKTLTYTGPQGQGSCTFNYSRDREIQRLGDSILAVAETILEGARLETLLQHDPLGLDQEMEYLTEAVADGQAQQIGAISGILERLAQDDGVLERVRRQAKACWHTARHRVHIGATFWLPFVSNTAGYLVSGWVAERRWKGETP